MDDNDKIILRESDESAKFVTNISGWVDRHGNFYGEDEKLARYSGCTHNKCNKCNNVYSKHTHCKICFEREEIQRYNNLPRKEWDRKTPLYSLLTDKYYFDIDYIFDDMSEYNIKDISEFRFIICRRTKISEIHRDYWADDIDCSGDCEFIIPDNILDALDVLNKEIRTTKLDLWEPSDIAAIVNMEPKK